MTEGKNTPGGTDRRSNMALRALIDAMLERVRTAQQRAAEWSPEERRSAEQDLAAIMERVKQEATTPPPAKPGSGE